MRFWRTSKLLAMAAFAAVAWCVVTVALFALGDFDVSDDEH
jgi:hypothetical protein